MNIKLNGQDFDMTPENTAIIHYPNDLMDGIYFDVDEQNYAFVSRWVEGYADMVSIVSRAGIELYDLSDQQIDLEEPPHLFIISALGKLTVTTAEWCLREK